MFVPIGVVRVGRSENVLIQVEGSGTMRESPAMAQFTERSLAGGATSVRVDLSRCVYVDSTFLGTLLSMKRSVGRLAQGSFALVAPATECWQLMQRMKLDRVFPVESAIPAEPAAWTELDCPSPDADDFEAKVITAHQELANVEGPCGAVFRPVADRLTKEHELRAKTRG